VHLILHRPHVTHHHLALLRRQLAAFHERLHVSQLLSHLLQLLLELLDLSALRSRRGGRFFRESSARSVVAAELSRTERALPKLEELEPLVRARLADLRSQLTADTGLGRLALGSLLGEDRLAVHADGRIKGTAFLQPETLCAPRRSPGRIAVVVARARFEPVSEAMGGRAPAR
jgi:hypothetical protein